MNPFNRKQESEADYLGMIFPHCLATTLEKLKNMGENEGRNKGKEQPQFMSTHPLLIIELKVYGLAKRIIINYPPIV